MSFPITCTQCKKEIKGFTEVDAVAEVSGFIQYFVDKDGDVDWESGDPDWDFMEVVACCKNCRGKLNELEVDFNSLIFKDEG